LACALNSSRFGPSLWQRVRDSEGDTGFQVGAFPETERDRRVLHLSHQAHVQTRCMQSLSSWHACRGCRGLPCAGGPAEARAARARRARRHHPAGALPGADQHVCAGAPGRLRGVGRGQAASGCRECERTLADLRSGLAVAACTKCILLGPLARAQGIVTRQKKLVAPQKTPAACQCCVYILAGVP